MRKDPLEYMVGGALSAITTSMGVVLLVFCLSWYAEGDREGLWPNVAVGVFLVYAGIQGWRRTKSS